MEEKINKLWETNFTKEDLIKLCDEIYNLGWNSAVKQKNLIIGILMKEKRDIIYTLKQQKPICAGSCGAGCEILVEKLIKELEK